MQVTKGNISGRVVGQDRLNDSLRLIYITTEQPLVFRAGQFTKIGLPGEAGKRDLMRPYSFVNSPNSTPHQFCYSVIDKAAGGLLTPKLDMMKNGDQLMVAARPTGFLVVEEVPEADYMFFLATGTGIGPFLSILGTDKPWQMYKKICLVFSVRTIVDLAFLDQIKSVEQQHSDQFVFVPIVTREDYPGGLKIRITVAFSQGEIQRRTAVELSPTNCQFMLCGNPAMITDTSKLLAEMGFPRHRRRAPGNVTIEKYW